MHRFISPFSCLNCVYYVRYVFDVTARHGGSGSTSACTVTVTVGDKNDAPYWSPAKDGSGYLPALSIEERSKRNTRIGGTDFATDEDVGQGLEYTIIAGNEDGMFWMRQCNGQVYVNKDMASSGAELDYNSKQFYDLTVQVQDDLNFFLPNDQKTITATLRINVSNVRFTGSTR